MTIRIRIPLEDGQWKEIYIPLSDEQYTLTAVVTVLDDKLKTLDERRVYVNRARKPCVVISSLGSK